MPGVTIARARQSFPEIVNRAFHSGERVVIYRGGKEIAAVVSMEDLAILRMLEDRRDAKAARAALVEMKRKGSIPWTKLKAAPAACTSAIHLPYAETSAIQRPSRSMIVPSAAGFAPSTQQKREAWSAGRRTKSSTPGRRVLATATGPSLLPASLRS